MPPYWVYATTQFSAQKQYINFNIRGWWVGWGDHMYVKYLSLRCCYLTLKLKNSRLKEVIWNIFAHEFCTIILSHTTWSGLRSIFTHTWNKQSIGDNWLKSIVVDIHNHHIPCGGNNGICWVIQTRWPSCGQHENPKERNSCMFKWSSNEFVMLHHLFLRCLPLHLCMSTFVPQISLKRLKIQLSSNPTRWNIQPWSSRFSYENFQVSYASPI